METICIQIRQENVYEEVAKATDYTGSKLTDGDENAYGRILATDEDLAELGRFWEESRADICHELIGLVKFEGMVDDTLSQEPTPVTESIQSVGTPSLKKTHYELILYVPKLFDYALVASMRNSLQSFFVHSIIAKWYVFSNKNEAGYYADKAAALLDDLHLKAMYKKKPTRPNYD